MSNNICFKFLGNMARNLGYRVCIDIEQCISIEEALYRALNRYGVSIQVEDLAYIFKDSVVNRDDNVCNYLGEEISVVRVVQGGVFM